MKAELLDVVRCPKCYSGLIIDEQILDEVEIVEGTLKCENCGSNYRIENGMPFLYVDDQNWKSKALEAKGWVDYHKSMGIYDQTGVKIDFILPYFNEEPWIKVSRMFDICLDILNLKGSEKILDLGAARGWAAKNFALKGCKSVAIEIASDDQIGLGRSKALIKESGTYYERIIGDNENMPFNNNTFDIVFCAAVLHHSSKLKELLINAYRVMADNGMFIAINEPCIGIFEKESEVLRDSEELKFNINETRPNIIQYYNSFMEAGFTNIHIFPYDLHKKKYLWKIKEWVSRFTIDKKTTKILQEHQYLSKTHSDSLINSVLLQYGGEIIITAEKIQRLKIAFVVQRYGFEVNGGSELHCRWIAEHLSKYYDVEVITTCAKDYMTWKDEYEPGIDNINGIIVRRFPVDAPRDVHKFNKFSEKIFGNKHSAEDELEWMKLQGPYSTELLDFIKDNKDTYDLFIFFTYLYCTTFFGLPLVKEKAILVPTAHDEPPIYLSIFNPLFKNPKTIIYNTEEEKKFINSKFMNENITSDIVGVGIDVPEKIDAENFKKKYKVDNFIIYVGRIDESKGCKELFNYFINWKETLKQTNIKLILLGNAVMKIPKHPDIIHLGFVSEQDKFNGIKASIMMIMPSQYESLSMVIMESWLCNNAVLVNGNCEVLKGHCIKSNGGLYYTNYEEFRECLNLLIANSHLRSIMGANGRRYVEDRYSWEKIERKYIDILT